MTYRGRVKNGVIVLEPPASLPDGTEVKVDEVARPEDENAPTLEEELGQYIGQAEGLPADSSTNHDHYLYGAPRK
jgi:hypothetical protein